MFNIHLLELVRLGCFLPGLVSPHLFFFTYEKQVTGVMDSRTMAAAVVMDPYQPTNTFIKICFIT